MRSSLPAMYSRIDEQRVWCFWLRFAASWICLSMDASVASDSHIHDSDDDSSAGRSSSSVAGSLAVVAGLHEAIRGLASLLLGFAARDGVVATWELVDRDRVVDVFREGGGCGVRVMMRPAAGRFEPMARATVPSLLVKVKRRDWSL